MINYKHKIRLLRFIRKIFRFFNFKIFYSKDVNYLKELHVENIIDVGVAHGTKELLDNFPNAYFNLIEPNPVFWKHIEETLLKKFKGKLFKTAAGNSTGISDFYNFGNTSSFLQRQDYELKNKIKVKLDKLDNIIFSNNLKNTLLKIDAEGYELEVLKGSTNILNSIDYCIVELRLQNINTYNPSELINYLYKKNFYFHKIIKVYYVKYGIDFMDILFIKKSLI